MFHFFHQRSQTLLLDDLLHAVEIIDIQGNCLVLVIRIPRYIPVVWKS